jgi:hypothetical protein
MTSFLVILAYARIHLEKASELAQLEHFASPNASLK